MFWQILLLVLGLSHNYEITSASMQPSLMIGDVLPMRLTHLYNIGPQLFTPAPRPGDLVLFQPANEQGAVYVKRVAAVAGDTIAIEAGRLIINGNLVDRRELGRFFDSDSLDVPVAVTRYEETLPNGVTHQINEISDAELMDEMPERTIAAGHIFVLGDNRDRSLDSRYGPLGEVPITAIVAILAADRPTFFWTHHQ